MNYRVKWGNNLGNKYRAKSTEYNGKRYHSKMEAAYAAELDLRIKAKDIKAWKRQIRIPLIVSDIHVADYYIDFMVEHNDGTIEYIEVKGFETPEWRLKWKIFEAMMKHSNKILTIVK